MKKSKKMKYIELARLINIIFCFDYGRRMIRYMDQIFWKPKSKSE